MSNAQYAIILGAIYLAPDLHPFLRGAMGVALMIYGVASIFWGGEAKP